MSSISGAQVVARALRDEGIRFSFGIPGAQNLELYDCLDHSPDIQPVLITDERKCALHGGRPCSRLWTAGLCSACAWGGPYTRALRNSRGLYGQRSAAGIGNRRSQ